MSFKIFVSVLCLCLLLFFCYACAADEQQPTQNPSADVSDESADEPQPTPPMTFKDWESLPGTQIALDDPGILNPDPGAKGAQPYFYGEVISNEEEYLIVKPRVDLVQKPSYSEELLKHSESYIIPRTLRRVNDYIEMDEFSVGDLVTVHFADRHIYKDTKYGEIPVLRVVFHFKAIDERLLITAE